VKIMNFDRHRIDGDGSGGRMTGSHRVVVTLLLATPHVPAACGPSKQPPPADPIKEQISVVQTQLRELQTVRVETRKNADEQAAAVNDPLAAKVRALDKALEEHKNAAPPQHPLMVKPTFTAQSAPAKEPAKQKKPTAQSQQLRRQEP
jgi:hypothetical protein